MELKKEQCELLQEKLTAANSPEELVKAVKAMGCDLTDADAAGIWAKVKTPEETEGKLADESLKPVNGGKQEDIPQYEMIREYYKQKGPNPALILCIYYIPSPICYEIIQVIEKEEANRKSKC